MKKICTAVLTLGILVGMVGGAEAASARTCDQYAWTGSPTSTGGYTSSILLTMIHPWYECNGSRTPGRIWTTVHQIPLTVVKTVEPYGFFTGICISVSGKWLAAHSDAMSTFPQSIFEHTVQLNAMDTSRHCSIPLNIAQVNTVGRTVYREFGCSQLTPNCAGPAQGRCTILNNSQVGVGSGNAFTTRATGPSCAPRVDFGLNWSHGWYNLELSGDLNTGVGDPVHYSTSTYLSAIV